MGADRAVHVQDPAASGADALTRARLLAAAIREEAPELVFTGKTGVGDDEGQVGPMLGELLDRPHVGAVFELSLAESKFTAHRDIEGAVEIVEGELPAVIAWDKGEHQPRYPVAQGHHGREEEALRRQDAGRARRRSRPPSWCGSRSSFRRRAAGDIDRRRSPQPRPSSRGCLREEAKVI
jgi:electron transfer flavoprotein beta subunit